MTNNGQPAVRSASAGLLLVAFLWGATFATSKLAVGDVPPLASATLRFGMAAVALSPLYWRERRGMPLVPHDLRAWGALVLLALTAVFGYNALFFGGLAHAPSSDSILLIPTTNPIWTAIFAALILGERVTLRLRIGMLLAIGGMLLVLLGGPSSAFGGERLLGNVMFIGAAIVFGLSHVMGRLATRHVSPLGATTLAGFIGTAMLLPAALFEGGLADLRTAPPAYWLAISFVAFGGTALGYVLWYRGVAQLGAGNTGFYTNLVPLFGLAISAVLLREYPTVLQVVGGMVMLGAVVWAMRRPRPLPVTTVPLTNMESR